MMREVMGRSGVRIGGGPCEPLLGHFYSHVGHTQPLCLQLIAS